MKFASYEDAESFLLRDKTIIKAEQKYADLFIADDIIFRCSIFTSLIISDHSF